MSQIHIIDGQSDAILDFITSRNIIDDTHKKSLEDTLETYAFITFADRRFSQYLEKRNRIVIPDEDGSLAEFVIFEAARYKDKEGYKTQVYADASYLELKKSKVVYPDDGFSGSVSQHAGRALDDTGWQVGKVESANTRIIAIESHTNPYEVLKRIALEFELELRFRVEHNGNKITNRYVDLLERVGTWRGREIEFGKDLDRIRRVEKQDVVTALLGLGPEDENGNRLEVLVEDEDALRRWGRADKYGNMQHLIEPYEIQSDRTEMVEEEARRYTRTALNKRINTQITYETTVVDLESIPGMENKQIRFGDTIRIKDTSFNPPLYLEARVFEQERSIKSKAKKDIKLGDYVEYTEDEVNTIWKQLQKQIKDRISYYELAEYTYDRLTIDNKNETTFENGKSFAEAVGVAANEYAVNQDSLIEVEVKQYADNVAEQKAESALDQAKIYAVAQEIYNIQVQNLISDISDRAPIEYVDGKFVTISNNLDDLNTEIEKKVNGDTVYTISQIDNMINNVISVTQYTADKEGIIDTLNTHSSQIGQNAQAIELKVSQSSYNTKMSDLDGSISTINSTLDTQSSSISVLQGQIVSKVSQTEVADYVASRGENLVTNGTGLLGDNTNFSAFVFDGSESYYSAGSFKKYSVGTINTDEFMPVNPELRYKLSMFAKTLNGVGKYFAFVNCYDVDELAINAQHHMYRASTLTTLAQELKNGDTVVHLTSAVNWYNDGTSGVNTHLRSIILWDYVNSFGYKYPPLTYSRHWTGNAWEPGSIDFVNNTVTLRVPWAGGTVPAGTQLSNGSAGGSYKYVAMSSTIVPTEWTAYSGVMSGVDLSGTNASNKFPPGTAKTKIGWLMNYQSSGETIWITNLEFSVDYQGQIDSATTRISTAESSITQLNNSISLKVDTSTYTSGLATKENTVYKQSTAPAHSNGRLWLDTSVTPNQLKRSTGSAWVKATPSTASEVGAYSATEGSALASRISTAELKITDSAIVSTVRASSLYINDLDGKVSSEEIISEINQSAEAIKIQASKINLVGAVTVLSNITGNLGTITAGNINGTTITGATVRTSSSGSRLEMSSNTLKSYYSSVKRTEIDYRSANFYDPAGTLLGKITADTNEFDGTTNIFGIYVPYSPTYGRLLNVIVPKMIIEQGNNIGESQFIMEGGLITLYGRDVEVNNTVFEEVETVKHNFIRNTWVGIKLLNNSATIQVRNASDNAYATLTVGNLRYYGDLYNASDIRLKKSIIPFEVDALDVINQIPMYTFLYNQEDENVVCPHYGTIYQEAPLEIRTKQDMYDDPDLNAIDMGKVTWLSVKAIQQLNINLEFCTVALYEEIARLNEKIENLESRIPA